MKEVSIIKGIRSTRGGKRILISPEKNLEAVNVLHKALTENGGSLKAHKIANKEPTDAIHIRSLEVTTTVEEVREALGPDLANKY